MSDQEPPAGKTTVSPGVLMDIARMAALDVPGVKGVGRIASYRDRLLRSGGAGGVRMSIQDKMISGDIHVVVKAGFNIREVCRDVQQQVARAIQEMAGMHVTGIDVHVEGIEFEGTEA
jgi:uncharacterized alkaline shock family protein YloU